MFAGHFGVAAAVRAKTPELPLWTLMLGTQLLDVAFVPLLLTGVETLDDSSLGGGYGRLLIHADYTHSLLGALLLALAAAWAVAWWRGKRAGYVMGAVVFSHWLLDLLVHRADMPILPGNWGDLPLLGLGAQKFAPLAIGLELLLLVIGAVMYVRSAWQRAGDRGRRAALLSSAVLIATLAFALFSDVAGLF